VNEQAPFLPADLEELHAELLSRAARVVPMRDIFMGDSSPQVIGLRHDVDDNNGSFQTALRMAEWEFEHGYSSTYFLLHGSHYWGDDMLALAPEFEELGHEVGIHCNAIAEALRTMTNPHVILADALKQLRSCGVRVAGSVAHGDQLCHKARFVNDEIFSECARPDYGEAHRMIRLGNVTLLLEQLSYRVFGLEYDANWLAREQYLSDSGGSWSRPFDDVVAGFGKGQLHVLQHPDWWAQAFEPAKVAA
jgi:hypothetical protein